VLAEVRLGRGTARELTRRVYGSEVADELFIAAEMTMRAHLEKLVDEGKVRVSKEEGEDVFEAS
jgi:predicted ArsR family transcriptional regulator